MQLHSRFRGFLPVVIDLETGGFDEHTNPILELCAVFLAYKDGVLVPKSAPIHLHVEPFIGCKINQKSLEFTGIQLNSALRNAKAESEVLTLLFHAIELELSKSKCSRAILVGHNAFFDLSFIKAAAHRCQLKSPLHSFSTLDTLSLGALIYGETVLSTLMSKAEIDFDDKQAHSALYDAQKTAELFCKMITNYDALS